MDNYEKQIAKKFMFLFFSLMLVISIIIQFMTEMRNFKQSKN